MLRMIVQTPRRRVTQHAEDATTVNRDFTDSNDTIPTDETTTVEKLDDGLEPWPDHAEDTINRLNIQDWVSDQRERKWIWAKRVCESDPAEWTVLAMTWDPRRHNALQPTTLVDDRDIHDNGGRMILNTMPGNIGWILREQLTGMI